MFLRGRNRAEKRRGRAVLRSRYTNIIQMNAVAASPDRGGFLPLPLSRIEQLSSSRHRVFRTRPDPGRKTEEQRANPSNLIGRGSRLKIKYRAIGPRGDLYSSPVERSSVIE